MKKLLALLLALLMVTVGLVSCKKDDDGTEGSDTTAGGAANNEDISKRYYIVSDGESDFVLVYPKKAGDNVVQAALEIKSLLKMKTGVDMKVSDDESVAADSAAKEILIGSTNRSESDIKAELAGYKDYIVKLTGNKLVIAGGCDEATIDAISYFRKMVIEKIDSKELKAGNAYVANDLLFTYHYPYSMENLTLLGTSVKDYKIVVGADCSFTEYRMALRFMYSIMQMTGRAMDIVKDDTEASAHEIRIGKTNRTAASAERGEYVINVNDGSLEFISGSLFGYEALYDYVWSSMLAPLRQAVDNGVFARTDFTTKLENGTLNAFERNEEDFRIMFHNIWGYDSAQNAISTNAQRNQMLTALYAEYNPDILCLQEVNPVMRDASAYPIAAGLEKIGYAVADVGKIGIYDTVNPILYRTDKLRLVKCGYDVIDGFTDGNVNTWAVFETLDGEGKVGVVNVHYTKAGDDKNFALRNSQAAKTIERATAMATEYECSVMVGGDMNCNVSASPFKNLLNAGFSDVQDIAVSSENYNTNFGYPTYNSYLDLYEKASVTLSVQYDEKAIDHVLLKGNAILCKTFDIVTDNFALCASDHAPLLIDFSIKTASIQDPIGEYTPNY